MLDEYDRAGRAAGTADAARDYAQGVRWDVTLRGAGDGRGIHIERIEDLARVCELGGRIAERWARTRREQAQDAPRGWRQAALRAFTQGYALAYLTVFAVHAPTERDEQEAQDQKMAVLA